LKSLFAGGFAGRNDPHDAVAVLASVHHHDQVEPVTHTHQLMPIVAIGLIHAGHGLCMGVRKGRLRFMERNTVLPDVGPVLGLVPLKFQMIGIENM
jgi:hypothetical protein